MLEIAILTFTVLLNLLLGWVVYLKNPQNATNRLFFMLTSVFTLWASINYLSVHPLLFSQLFLVRLVLFCSALLNLSVFLTFLTFPAAATPKKYQRQIKLAVFATAFIMLLTLTPLVFKELKVTNGHASPVPAPGIGLFLLQTIGLLGGGIVIIVRKYRSSEGKVHEQLRLVLLGVAGTFGLIVLSNFLLVVLFNFTFLVPFGPAFSLIFSISFAYAIARHRLFDIRAAIARSVAYLLIIGTMSLVYGFILFGLVDAIFAGPHWEYLRQGLGVILVTPLALSFQYIKQFFDKLSNRLFYRDAYDAEAFLSAINQVLVSTFDLNGILHKSSALISKNLSPNYSVFGIKETTHVPRRIIGSSGHPQFGDEDIALVRKITPMYKERLIVTDYIDDGHEALKATLQKYDIAVIARLALVKNEEGIGYLILGPKKSGNPYSPSDLRIIQIMANELAIGIQNALRFEEIENFNLTLQDKINEATRQIRRSNEKLKALDETKDDFISMASHQLRTPLTSVKGYLSMILEGDAGKLTPMQKEMLGQAFFSSQRMVYLIADLLNVSRLKTGKFIIESNKVNLSSVIQEELEQLQETAASRQLTLQYDKPKDFPDLMLDETKIRQVIMNFVDNAIYYTPAGGHITVRLLNKTSTVELRVEDNGIGVPKSEQPHLFTKFYRAGNARKARPDGTGLGLFMAKKVIAAQGGSILFASQEGKGSMFGFVFSKAHLRVPEGEKPATPAATK